MSEKSKNPRIEIKTGVSGMFTEVWIDGHKINGIRSYKLECGGKEGGPRLTIDLNALNLSVDVPLLDIRHEELGTMEIDFTDGDYVDENGNSIPHHISKFSQKTGIPENKIMDFVKQNSEKKER